MLSETIEIIDNESDSRMNSKSVKPKILIAEDDPENQKFFELILKKEFDLILCDSEKSFFTKLNSNKFDAILMDVNLKDGKSGIEIIKKMRKKTNYVDIPVVCLSADLYSQEKAKTGSLGIDAYLIKPINKKLLVGTIKKVIEGKN